MGFESIADQVSEQIDAKYGAEGTSAPSQDSQQQQSDLTQSNPATQQQQQTIAQAIAELDKMEKFKFEGQEWTPKTLKEAILRMQDYTQKTQALSKDRENFQKESKFVDTLYYDLDKVRANPSLAKEFVKLYPERYHGILKEVLSETSNSTSAQSQHQETRPQVDVELLSRLEKLEKGYYESSKEKHQAQIQGYFSEFQPKYPDAMPQLVMAQAMEAYNSGGKLSKEDWESFFKHAHQQVSDFTKAKYGEMVKKQTESNSKAKDVASGGGTPGSAPRKFKSLKEVAEYAEKSLTGG